MIQESPGFIRGECQHYNDNTNLVYVWAEKVYIFADDALVTVLNLPTRYRNTANSLGRKNAD